jgi:hypothetical protein
MGKRTSHAPGTFSWIDLATTNPEAAKGFYGELFGWGFDEQPVPGGSPYNTAILDGDRVAALYEQSSEQREQGIPPYWSSYVTVETADGAAARATSLGGTVVMGPFDVMDAGRLAVVQDPVGAMLGLWEPRASIGATLVNDVGSLTWNELGTPDVETASRFYSELFGWEMESMETGGGPAYVVIKNGERSNGGIREQSAEEQEMGVPANWLAYFTVASADDAAAKAADLGAQTLVPPMDVPGGAAGSRIAALADPQGAAFAVFEGEVDD